MRKCLRDVLLAYGLIDSVALITDGRFSGGRAALASAYSPEAASGGPIAALKDGDIINIEYQLVKSTWNLLIKNR